MIIETTDESFDIESWPDESALIKRLSQLGYITVQNIYYVSGRLYGLTSYRWFRVPEHYSYVVDRNLYEPNYLLLFFNGSEYLAKKLQ